MKKSWWYGFALFAMVISLGFIAGCADDNEDTPDPGPQPDPVIGTWDAQAFSLQPLGVSEMVYFLRDDSTYQWYQRFEAVELRELGTYRTTSDSIRFHATLRDDVAIDEQYSRWYDLSGNEDTLKVRYLFDQLYTVSFVRR